jgi:hypothetical protein
MNEKSSMNIETRAMQEALGRFLKARTGIGPAADGPHLDEDTIAAFAEGALSMRESENAVRHLVDCGFCLKVTADILRFDAEFLVSGETIATQVRETPSSIADVIGSLFGRIFGIGESAVFAHEEKPADEKADREEKDDGAER